MRASVLRQSFGAAVLGVPLVLSAVAGCTRRELGDSPDAYVPSWPDAGGSSVDVGIAPTDANRPDSAIDAASECASVSVAADVTRLPVDIIWVVDNSSSMASAIEQVQAGMNAFAARLAASDLDYRLIVLSLRGSGEATVNGGTRYRLCIPPPVGGAACADNAPRFYQREVDIKSTQPLEQILGTLAQSAGFREGDERGCAPWRDLLRAEATKSIVLVTDDNGRLCGGPGGCYSGGSWSTTWTCSVSGAVPFDEPEDFETYPGGLSPFNRQVDLGPGLLTATYVDPDYGPIFEGYTFNAIYGWGSDTDDRVACGECGSASEIASPGPTYSALVRRTGGVRARLCDGASAWGPFFETLATNVVDTSRIACEVDIPAAPDGMFFLADRVNVRIHDGDGSTTLGRVSGVDACNASTGGWYYDDPSDPTKILLCPASCDYAREVVNDETDGIDVGFGCDSVLG